MDDDYRQAVEVITEELGLDASSISPTFLRRRLRARMLRNDLGTLSEYVAFLRDNSHEQSELKDFITVNVTRFFRDRPMWDSLEATVFPVLIPPEGRRFPLRIWSAGCSSGEEAYSVAIAASEYMRRKGVRSDLRVTASDIDRQSLEVTRKGVYPDKSMEKVPAPIRRRYFEPVESDTPQTRYDIWTDSVEPVIHYRIKDEVRSKLRVVPHDLTGERPPGYFDLVLCRNVLIYFTHMMHTRVIGLLHRALRHNGFLVLGKSEILRLRQRQLFDVVDSRERIFQKGSPPGPRVF